MNGSTPDAREKGRVFQRGEGQVLVAHSRWRRDAINGNQGRLLGGVRAEVGGVLGGGEFGRER